jgi:hypothetical protein
MSGKVEKVAEAKRCLRCSVLIGDRLYLRVRTLVHNPQLASFILATRVSWLLADETKCRLKAWRRDMSLLLWGEFSIA